MLRTWQRFNILRIVRLIQDRRAVPRSRHAIRAVVNPLRPVFYSVTAPSARKEPPSRAYTFANARLTEEGMLAFAGVEDEEKGGDDVPTLFVLLSQLPEGPLRICLEYM
jgi:hypothetical protein